MAVTEGKPNVSRRHRPRGLELVYEDRDILVVDKMPGFLTMSFHRDERQTAERVLTQYVKKGVQSSKKRVFVVHRLDRDTSGLLVFAKTFENQKKLKENWKNTEKYYLAVVFGHFRKKKGVFSSRLAENADQFVHSVDDPGVGKLAETHYTVIKETRTMSVLKIHLLTGRKNQIRVHLAENGCPVVNDVKYGGRTSRGRMALHAKTLAFDHPFTCKRLSFDTGIPDFFQKLAQGLDERDWT